MKRFLAALVGAASANVFAASNTRTQHFDTDPRWDGHNNRATTPAPVNINQNFGYSPFTGTYSRSVTRYNPLLGRTTISERC